MAISNRYSTGKRTKPIRKGSSGPRKFNRFADSPTASKSRPGPTQPVSNPNVPPKTGPFTNFGPGSGGAPKTGGKLPVSNPNVSPKTGGKLPVSNPNVSPKTGAKGPRKPNPSADSRTDSKSGPRPTQPVSNPNMPAKTGLLSDFGPGSGGAPSVTSSPKAPVYTPNPSADSRTDSKSGPRPTQPVSNPNVPPKTGGGFTNAGPGSGGAPPIDPKTGKPKPAAKNRVWSVLLSEWVYSENGVDAATRRAQKEKNYKENQMGRQARGRLDLATGALTDPTEILEKAKIEKLARNVNSNQIVGADDPTLGKVAGTAPIDAATGNISRANASAADASRAELATSSSAMADSLSGMSTAEAEAAGISAPDEVKASTAEATKSIEELKKTLEGLKGPEGKVSREALIDAITKDPNTLAQLGLDAAQITNPVTVNAPDPRELDPAELIDGSAVDWAKVEEKAQVEAATADPSKKATVAGQLEGLMAQFEGKNTPPWAAGAMRSANAMLQARGLGASSIAGQAVVQAAMEAALPIAMADAETFSKFELTNLSNRQQAAMLQAEQRAEFLGMDFNQEFQTKVANASKISDIANMNFTAEQQIALENARLAQTVDLANLDAKNAKVMADAAAMSNMEMANLSNMQQAAVENAKSFLAMDFKNLDNKQQDHVIKQQAYSNQILSDQAADNAMKQMNATNENQVKTFMANLVSQTKQFNSTQKTAISQFNAAEKNATEKFKQQQMATSILSDTAAENAMNQFNASEETKVSMYNAQMETQTDQFNVAQGHAMEQYNASAQNEMNKFNSQVENQRQQFESTMGLEIAMSNAKWRRDIALTDTNAENVANMELARTANGITQQSLDNLWQRERDLMSFAFTAAESYEDRNLQLLLADKKIGAEESSKTKEGIGYLVGSILFGGGGLF